ncbi:CDP-diacylglycerol--glycerol-3-phosphate 3-phosphatidyltransferase [Arenicella xantha]|uniref:CDP-diacylglycerol--glycerol-3-phosphate 3-phosphatidyltransferase n=1 Tax=Arenicella xantha TaxID=644221 RepID=A0A395JJA5_9GAMM|nr:CDP-diacylglycerol--glycerol-3-phosphate 3-phosphatidyltransferase [Arenicella xantha]RBP50771.1 CDP-diacylglycerol--glycerol-3-phosphate 3-phosphatidyltransferase/cardiolipin synthase [Arenicella xantha]
MKTMRLNIPNCLTLFRIIAIPLIAIIYFSDIKYGNWYSTIVFTLAGISDALDGYLARRWNQTSKLGAFLDPVADKLLVSTMLLLVISDVNLHSRLWSEMLFIVTVIVIISREITVSALREWMAELGKRANVAVSTVGKYKTGIQMGAIGCLLFQSHFIGLPVLLIGELMLYAAGVLTIWSMSIYLRAAYNAVKAD